MSKEPTFEETAYDMADGALQTAFTSIERLMGDITDGRVGEAETLKALSEIALQIVTDRKKICLHNKPVLGANLAETKWGNLHDQGCVLATATEEVMARYMQNEEKSTGSSLRSAFR